VYNNHSSGKNHLRAFRGYSNAWNRWKYNSFLHQNLHTLLRLFADQAGLLTESKRDRLINFVLCWRYLINAWICHEPSRIAACKLNILVKRYKQRVYNYGDVFSYRVAEYLHPFRFRCRVTGYKRHQPKRTASDRQPCENSAGARARRVYIDLIV
jgi:hypothetical protein